ncbi:restriction endonuclease subunit S, partial [Streptococcus macedonicus]
TRQSVGIQDLRTLMVSLPIDIEEQKQIGSFFYELDSLITLHQRECDLLVKMKKSYLQKMFPKNGEDKPEIRFDGYTDAWEQRKLGEMGSTYTGLSGKTKEDFGHGNAKFITYMNVFSNPIANLEMTDLIEVDQKQNKVKKGDVFFTTSSETPEEVGMSCVMPVNADNIYLNSFCFGYRPEVEFDSNYLAYVLRADAFRKEMRILAQGISRYNISKAKVMEVEISVPSLKEQKLVGSYFSTLDNLITLHQRELDSLKKMKKSLLQMMFV